MTRRFQPRYLALISIVVFGALGLAGCNDDNLFTGAPGQYQGTFLMRKSGKVTQTIVTGQIVAKSKRELQLQVTSLKGGQVGNFGITALSDSKIRLVLPWSNAATNGQTIDLSGSAKSCFSSASATAPDVFSAALCFNGTDLTIDLNWGQGGNAVTLSVSRSLSADHPTFEKPQAYTVSEIFNRAMTQNFDSPIQFQRVVQAKLTTEMAYLKLLPHISVNDVLNVSSGAIATNSASMMINYLKAVGDLVPFLFPTRWLEAKSDRYKSEAEFDAWTLTKADAANVAEGLAYTTLRDSILLKTSQNYLPTLSAIRDKIREKETAGLQQINSSDDVLSIMNQLDQSISLLGDTVTQEKMSVAEAAGFYNFGAITDIDAPEDTPIDNVQPYDDATIQSLSDLSLDRSYERRQIMALTEAARVNHTASYFQWLDPSGDPNGALGFNLVPYVQISASQTQELIAKREKIEAGLIDAVARSAASSNQYLASYKIARDGVQIQERRVQRQLDNLDSNINFSMSELTDALQLKLKMEIELLQDQYNYYVARANLNRLLLTGPYALLPTDRGQPAWVISATVDLR